MEIISVNATLLNDHNLLMRKVCKNSKLRNSQVLKYLTACSYWILHLNPAFLGRPMLYYLWNWVSIIMCFMYIGAAGRMSCNVTSSDSVVLETDDGEQLYISCTGKTICVQYSATGEQYEVIGFHQRAGDLRLTVWVFPSTHRWYVG